MMKYIKRYFIRELRNFNLISMKSKLFRSYLARIISIRSSRALSNSNISSPLKQLLDEASSYGDVSNPEPELRWATEPYARLASPESSLSVDPRETTVLLFPGQGSQYVGMGKKLLDLPAVRDLYELASSIVGWDVARVCTQGPEKELQRRCQVAVLVTSLAALERVREERPAAVERVRAAAGYSVGELAALVFADALSFEHALRLTELRSAAIQAAVAERPCGALMLRLATDAKLGDALRRAREYALENGVPQPVCTVAAYLHPGCKVVAGDEAGLHWLQTEGHKCGIKRAVRMPPNGDFNTPLMASAADAVRAGLRHIQVRAPRVPVLSCVDARPYRDAVHVRRQLARLTCAPLRWEQVLHALYARPRDAAQPFTLALGPGVALRSTLRLVNARAWDASLQVSA